MQTKRILQAVVLISVVALAAGCAATKEYSSKLFKSRTDEVKDSQAMSFRFLDLDKIDGDKEDWVNTDIIMGRDTLNSTAALDNLAKTFPAKSISAENTRVIKEEITTPVPVFVSKKPEVEPAIQSETVIKKSNPVKKTETKSSATIVDTKPTTPSEAGLVIANQPVAKNLNGTRNKKTREE